MSSGMPLKKNSGLRFEATTEPLLWFGVYDSARDLSLEAARTLLESSSPAGDASVRVPSFDMGRAAYGEAFEPRAVSPGQRGHLSGLT